MVGGGWIPYVGHLPQTKNKKKSKTFWTSKKHRKTELFRPPKSLLLKFTFFYIKSQNKPLYRKQIPDSVFFLNLSE